MNNIVQGTEEWFAARAGKVTASRIADVLATIKSGESASRANYRAQLISERLTGKVEESFTNSHMERGTALEPYAREAYELQTGSIVEQVGFIDHPVIAMSGASPDGLVGLDGCIEIKCMTQSNHIKCLIDNKHPKKYYPQMQWQLACTGRKWNDFVSFCPEFETDLQIFVERVKRDDEYISSIEKEILLFNKEIEETIKKLKAIRR